jgi:hypothetical protein
MDPPSADKTAADLAYQRLYAVSASLKDLSLYVTARAVEDVRVSVCMERGAAVGLVGDVSGEAVPIMLEDSVSCDGEIGQWSSLGVSEEINNVRAELASVSALLLLPASEADVELLARLRLALGQSTSRSGLFFTVGTEQDMIDAEMEYLHHANVGDSTSIIKAQSPYAHILRKYFDVADTSTPSADPLRDPHEACQRLLASKAPLMLWRVGVGDAGPKSVDKYNSYVKQEHDLVVACFNALGLVRSCE